MIGVCTKCHKLYDFGSEESAYEPDRLCATCYREAHAKPVGYAALDADLLEPEPKPVATLARVRDLEAQLNAAVLGQQSLARENAELQAKLDAVHDYATYYNSTWWQMYDDPDLAPMSFGDWYGQQQRVTK